MTKVCSKCGEERSTEDFSKTGFCNGKQMYRANCKKCVKIYNAQYCKSEAGKAAREKYQQSERGKATRKNYYQSEPYKEVRERYHQTEIYKEYHKKHRQSKAGKEYQKKYQQTEAYRVLQKKYKQSERGKARNKKYNQSEKGKASMARRSHRRRMRSKNITSDLTAKHWSEILYTQKNCCAHCGLFFTVKLPPTRDHIIPLSKGGGLTKDNVQALCRSCNSSKGPRSNEEWELDRKENE